MATTADQIAALRGQRPARVGDLLKHPQFSRLWKALAISSLGDWVGFVAVAALVTELSSRGGGNPAYAVSALMAARLLPSVLFGPFAGVLVDRFDRRRLMMVADVARGVMYGILPFFRPLWAIYLFSFAIECFSLLWAPAKDASLPNMVPKRQLNNANMVNLALAYGTLPLGGIIFTLLAGLTGYFGAGLPFVSSDEAFLALWLDGATFLFSAYMVSGLKLRPARTTEGSEPFKFGQAFDDLRAGIRFMKDHTLARAMLLGIVIAFTGAGSVMSIGPIFASETLGGGGTAWGALVTSLGLGMGIGMASLTLINKYVEKETLFSGAMVLTAVAGMVLSAMPNVPLAAVLVAVVGACAGATWVTGYTILQENISDEFRGRVFGTLTTLARMGLFLSLAGFPLFAGLVGDPRLPFTDTAVPGERIALWAGGFIVLMAGIQSRRGLLRSRIARPRALNLHLRIRKPSPKGIFIAFEGVEGAGKGTQIELTERWLADEGRKVLVTREPGGTELGERLRDAVLSKDHPVVDARAETLVFAASRAQHVVSVIRPALAEGYVVLCDRYVDSSLAYQGVARGIGEQDVLQLNAWATQGLFPDLVVLLHLEPEKGMARKEAEGDRIEMESEDFHAKVADAYLHLAEEHPERFAVIDADAPPDVVQERVRDAVRPHLDEHDGDVGGGTEPSR